MSAREGLDAAALQAVMVGFRDGLRTHQDRLNRLNVYPVPDGDTGTNMALTVASVVDEVDALGEGPDLAAVCKAIAHGSLMGARGNSGVILSQLLRGLTGVLATAPGGVASGALVAEALDRAAASAYEAVGRPVEGTILTVGRGVADAATAEVAGAGDAEVSLLAVLEAAAAGGAEALARTPELLAVLAEAGVVDAGGSGLLLLIDAALQVVDGRPMPEPGPVLEPAAVGPLAAVGSAAGGAAAGGGERSIAELRYEVMYLLDAPDAAIPTFREVWAGVGDSIVVVGGDGLWNCHIHTDDVGAAIEAALDAGRPRNIRVTDLLDQVAEERWVREAVEGTSEVETASATEPAVHTGVVAVAAGEGIRRIFRSLGVHHVVTGGQTMNPSTAQLLEAVEACRADEVVVLPNNKNIVAVAAQLDGLTPKQVRVVPTRGVAEGFAALLAYDPDAEVDANTEAMAAAAAAVVTGEVTRAVRATSSEAGPIAEGDWLGLGGDGICSIHADLAEAAVGLLAALLDDGHEVLTLIEGEGASPAVTRHVTEWVTEHYPATTVEVHHGGQPLYPYLVGIE